jgi:hypothetical protein
VTCGKRTPNGRRSSDFIVDALRALGIDFVATMPSSSARGLHESLINYAKESSQPITWMHPGTEGGSGPSLAGERSRKNLAAAIAWIENPELPIPKLYPSPLSQRDVENIAAYIETL